MYLECFFRNLLLGEEWDLRNRYLHIAPSPEWKDQANLGKTQSSVTQKLTERQQEIVRLIKENNTISAGSMATTLGVTVRSIRRDIEVIRKYCSIQWIGPSKSGHWELKQQ